MRKFTIKQSYIVNSVLFAGFLCIVSLGLVGGCSNNNSSDSNNSIDATALTENDFSEDSSLRANPEKGVIVTFLESPASEESEDDTGILGVDEVPYTYPESVQQTFCWKDDNVEAMHFMELKDSGGNIILTLQANGDCVTVVLVAGNYEMSIYHDGSNEDSLPIFLIPNSQDSEQARKTEGLINRINVAAAKIFKAIQMTVTKDARAQTVEKNIETLLSTRKCIGCNLYRARFGTANLSDVDLTEADLRNAEFRFATLNRAIFTDADMRRADLRVVRMPVGVIFFTDADLRHADFRGGNLNGANFVDANLSDAMMRQVMLRNANLTGADLTRADLSSADLRDAIFRDAILTGTVFRAALLGGATWYDGCRCFGGSSGMCEGCQRADDLFFP